MKSTESSPSDKERVVEIQMTEDEWDDEAATELAFRIRADTTLVRVRLIPPRYVFSS